MLWQSMPATAAQHSPHKLPGYGECRSTDFPGLRLKFSRGKEGSRIVVEARVFALTASVMQESSDDVWSMWPRLVQDETLQPVLFRVHE
jgi:hypothetical protein